MNAFVECACPLCHSKAKCADYPARHLKHFVCRGCTDVVVKYKAESLNSVLKQAGLKK